MSEIASGDSFSKSGATRLKEAIEIYWRSRGRDVVVYLREAPFSAALRSTRFEICSNMLNGMPQPLSTQTASRHAR